ncbi:phage tail tape measure protein [Rathayibacter sp. AY2B5]|uniref:phage tail tape measure protein n=1 Tax=Rathayibacter sp. AY2B5 TaxID=2080570 RepID=UPI000CE7FA7F|nr:phage tail tape measure protein [Rathayibacter sp. AY2B5]PPG44346.1 phage tail tape measure protein [Rathayibacter sp. AY2B5]
MDRTVKVTAILQAQQYIAGLEQMRRKTRETAADGKASLEDQRAAYQELGGAATAFGAVSAASVALSIAKFADFDAAMSQVQASTRESTSNMALLRDAALDAGANTAFSATEAANAIDELAKAGLSTEQILSGGLTGALSLAAAGQLSVARAAEISAISLSQFGLKGSDAAHVADVLAAGAGKALGSVDDLANGLKFVGPVAASMGISIEETTGTLALFAQAGILGEQAGTSLRSVLSALTSPSAAASKEIERLGITLFDANGKFVGMEATAGELSEAYRGMDDASRQASLGTIFGAESITAATLLYQGGAEGVAEWTSAVDDSGFAAEQARIALDNLKGDVDALGGALETGLIKSGSTANDVLRSLVQTGTGLTNMYNDLPASVQGTVFTLGAVAAATSLAGGAALLAVPKYAAMKVAMADANLSAGKLARGVAVAGGAITAASLALSGIGQYYADVSANAEALTGTLDQQTGAFTDSTRAMVVNILQQKGAYGDAARAAGISQRELTDAILEGGDALETVQKKLSAENTFFSFFDGTGIAAGNASAAIGEVEKSLDKSLEGYRNAKEANEGLTEASEGSAESAGAAAEAYITEADSVDQLVSRMTELLDAVNAANGVNQDAVSQNIAYQQSLSDVDAQIEKARAGVEGYSLGLDTNTQTGRDNTSMLLELAKNGQAAAKAQFDATGSTEGYRAALEASRQAVYDRALALTGNADAAQALADNIAAIPSETDWKVTAQTAAAQAQLETFIDRNSGRTITVNTVLKERVAGFNSAGGITSANGT